MKYVQKRLEPENNFNKIKIKKKPEKNHYLIVLDRVLVNKLNWFDGVDSKIKKKNHLCWYNVNMVLTTMKSKHPQDQITEFKQSQNFSGLVQDIQIYNVSYKTLL